MPRQIGPTHIKAAIKSIHATPHSWVLAQVRNTRVGLVLCLSIHEKKTGRKKMDAWSVICLGVREANVTDFDGGGLALYSVKHPAARQYLARRAKLRWSGKIDMTAVLGALYQAHMAAVDDWIPFDRYLSIEGLRGSRCVCQGPDFLMRAYAKVLRAQGMNPQLTLAKSKAKSSTLEVLHFGGSSIVAASFTAEHRSALCR